MNKALKYIIILIFISNCSLSKKENINNNNIGEIFKKSDPIKKEFNQKLKIKKFNSFAINPFLRNDTNNSGKINFDTNFEKISSYKISKIKNLIQINQNYFLLRMKYRLL